MKRTLLFIIILLGYTLNLLAQNTLTYTEVVEIKEVTKDELYNRAKKWFVTTYKSGNQVIQLDDKETGAIIGKASMKYQPRPFTGSEKINGLIHYTISINLKNGRYKYEITDFVHEPSGSQYGTITIGLITDENEFPANKTITKSYGNKAWIDIKEQIKIEVTAIITSIKTGMSKSSANDW